MLTGGPYVPMRQVLAVLYRRLTGRTRREARRGIARLEDMLILEAAKRHRGGFA